MQTTTSSPSLQRVGRRSTLSRRRVPGKCSDGSIIAEKKEDVYQTKREQQQQQQEQQQQQQHTGNLPNSILQINKKYYFKRIIDDQRMHCQIKEMSEQYVTVKLFDVQNVEMTELWEDICSIWSADGEVLVWTNVRKRQSTLDREQKRNGWVQ